MASAPSADARESVPVCAVSCHSCKAREYDAEEKNASDAPSGTRATEPAHPTVEPHVCDFWKELSRDIVERQAWRVEVFDETSARQLDTYANDVRHYPIEEERIRMKQRREGALTFRSNPQRWSRLVMDALRELAADTSGPATATLAHSGLLGAFRDFATHIHYFQVTRRVMESAGVRFSVNANSSSSIHDVDKLDPVVLTGYSERWEDVRDTALWRACFEAHCEINTHHQQNELWHSDDGERKEQECSKALAEMVCDKASRKLQKELEGVVSPEMWLVEPQFYLGMPDEWFDRATKMAKTLAEATPTSGMSELVT
ncbi:uncharacterized protein LOC144100820 [Amblyomma americanum]